MGVIKTVVHADRSPFYQGKQREKRVHDRKSKERKAQWYKFKNK